MHENNLDEVPLSELRRALEEAAVDLLPDVQVTFKPMFGGQFAYANGVAMTSLSNVGLALKLPPDAQAELCQIPGAKMLQYEPNTPVSKHYVVVPTRFVRDESARDELSGWVRRSADYVRSLPAPKPKSSAKSRAKTKGTEGND